MSSTKSLGTLVNDSVEFFRKHITPIVIGAVIFGFLTQGVGTWLVATTGGIAGWSTNMETWQEEMEAMGERMEELQEQATTGMLDEGAQAEMEAIANQMMRGSVEGMGMMRGVFMAMLPALGVSLIVTIIIGLIAKSYFLIIAIKGTKDAADAAGETAKNILNLVWMWIWIMLRTFIWIPFLGIILAIVLGPRFIATPVYVMENKKAVTTAATMSMKATLGYWGKIFGNVILVAIITMLASAFIGKVFMMILGGMIGGFIAAAIGELATAFLIIFSIHLARTIIAHPKTV